LLFVKQTNCMRPKPSKHKLPLTNSVGGLLRGAVLTLGLATVIVAPVSPAEEVARRVAKVDAKEEGKSPAPAEPRSAEDALKKGIEYLLKQQQPDGGWGQGGGWRQDLNKTGGRVDDKKAEDPSDVGNTCVSLMALVRNGDTSAKGDHKDSAAKAFDFICRYVEKADEDSIYVTPVRDTQLQVKIGAYVDTFLAGWVLSELKSNLPDEDAEKRRAAALDKVVRKIEKNQKTDGTFAGNTGWAAVLSQGLCSKALNGAARSGANVSQQVLEKDKEGNLAGLDVAKGAFTAPASPTAEPSSAGVSLYRETAKLGGLWEKSRTNDQLRQKAEKVLADKDAPAPKKAEAQQQLDSFAQDQKAAQAATKAVAGNLNNAKYVAGFGNNGGEEFLSYLNLTESLRDQGGKEWDEWKPKVKMTVSGAQNEDGSWAGHHCITGRTFCTSTALLALLAEKTPVPVKVTSVTPTGSDKVSSKE
jgi:Prenyltransferase and squalene oxidase repeat